MIKIVSFKICPFVQRVTAALETRSIPYRVEYISLSNPPDWFSEVSPNAQVPLLITESGTVLFESDAIVEDLDEAYGPMQKDISPEQHAIDRAWSYQASKHYLVQCSAMRSSDEDTLASRARDLGKSFARVENVLEEGPYFHGQTLGNVDVAWLPLLHRAALVEKHSGYNFLDEFPKVKTWQSALMATGLAEKSVSDDFEEEFSDFYLSDETYLGKGGNCSKTMGDVCGTAQCCG
jgi:glutathione S-transferase